jgi:WhiB family redox-sensing transcriptional regulator
MSDVIAGLFGALDGIPALPGAACKGKADLFEGRTDDDIDKAIQICGRCPSRQPCADWAASLPRNRVTGIVAGRVVVWSDCSRRKSA